MASTTVTVPSFTSTPASRPREGLHSVEDSTSISARQIASPAMVPGSFPIGPQPLAPQSSSHSVTPTQGGPLTGPSTVSTTTVGGAPLYFGTPNTTVARYDLRERSVPGPNYVPPPIRASRASAPTARAPAPAFAKKPAAKTVPPRAPPTASSAPKQELVSPSLPLRLLLYWPLHPPAASAAAPAAIGSLVGASISTSIAPDDQDRRARSSEARTALRRAAHAFGHQPTSLPDGRPITPDGLDHLPILFQLDESSHLADSESPLRSRAPGVRFTADSPAVPVASASAHPSFRPREGRPNDSFRPDDSFPVDATPSYRAAGHPDSDDTDDFGDDESDDSRRPPNGPPGGGPNGGDPFGDLNGVPLYGFLTMGIHLFAFTMHSPTPDAIGFGCLVLLPRTSSGISAVCYEIADGALAYAVLDTWYLRTVRHGFVRRTRNWAASILHRCGRTPDQPLAVSSDFVMPAHDEPRRGVPWPTNIHLHLREDPGFAAVRSPYAYFAVDSLQVEFDFFTGLLIVEDRALLPCSEDEQFILRAAGLPLQPNDSAYDQWISWTLAILRVPQVATTPGLRFRCGLPPRRRITPAPSRAPPAFAAPVLPSNSVAARSESSDSEFVGLPTSFSGMLERPGSTSVPPTRPRHGPTDDGFFARTANPSLRRSRGHSGRTPGYRQTPYSADLDKPAPTIRPNPAYSKEEHKTYRTANSLPVLKATDMTKDVPEILSFRMSLINAHRSMVTDSVDDRGPVYLDDGSFFVGLLSIKNFETLSGRNFFHSLKSLQKLRWTSFLKQFDSHFLGPTADEKIRNTWINYRWPNASVDSPVVALNQLSLLNEHLKEPYDETRLKEYLIHSCRDELLRYQMVAEPFFTADGGVRKFHDLDITPLQVAERMSLVQATYNRRSETIRLDDHRDRRDKGDSRDSRGMSPRRSYVSEDFSLSFFQQPAAGSRRDDHRLDARRDEASRARSVSRDRASMPCHRCKQTGHLRDECPYAAEIDALITKKYDSSAPTTSANQFPDSPLAVPLLFDFPKSGPDLKVSGLNWGFFNALNSLFAELGAQHISRVGNTNFSSHLKHFEPNKIVFEEVLRSIFEHTSHFVWVSKVFPDRLQREPTWIVYHFPTKSRSTLENNLPYLFFPTADGSEWTCQAYAVVKPLSKELRAFLARPSPFKVHLAPAPPPKEPASLAPHGAFSDADEPASPIADTSERSSESDPSLFHPPGGPAASATEPNSRVKNEEGDMDENPPPLEELSDTDDEDDNPVATIPPVTIEDKPVIDSVTEDKN
ncbi:hypothetical protein DFJ73DRAFT_920277, partial [Zopfochytrium polystomum]